MSLAQPRIQDMWPPGWRQMGNPQLCFLRLDKARCLWALPWALSQNGWDRGGLLVGTESVGGLRVHSMKNSPSVFSEPLESYLLGEWMGWIPHHEE